ncbi:MAG: DUF6644 family protein [Bryobacteraceae bacterium]
MSAPSIFEWLTTSPWANAMNGPEWAFPLVQSLHFIGFAFSIGTIAIVDLRLLGWAMRRQSAADLAADLDRWTWVGFGLMLITGPLMFSADAVAYHNNPSFQFKMTVLFVALLYHFTIHRKVARSAVPPLAAKLAGGLSLVLWTAVVAGGRMIAFV